MKHTYLGLVLSYLLLTVGAKGQTVEYLSINNLNVGIGIGGNLFSVLPDSLSTLNTENKYFLFEAPKGSGIKALATSTLWFSGTDPGNSQHCAVQLYKSHGGDFSDGPVVSQYDAAYDTLYRRVFKISRQQIIHHQTLNFPVPRASVDSSLLKWPGRGNAWIEDNYGVTIADDLAHFIDANANGIYDPWNGDYPALCGDEGIFFVFNDARFPHFESGSTAVGVEVRGMAETYFRSNTSLTKDPLNNSIFVTYEIVNKSLINYHDFYVAAFEDAELGCYANDKMGCDTNRNLMFAYNFIAHESACSGEPGYQDLKVSLGTLFPENASYAFGRFLTDTSFANSDPETCTDATNYMQGKWKDGTPFTEGGSGYGGSTPTTHLFTGNPSDSITWRDFWQTTVFVTPDRRMYSSFRSSNFNAGELMTLPMVFIFSNDTGGTHLTIVDSLKRDADSIQEFYNSVFKPCHTANTILSNSAPELRTQLFPNPSDGYFTIKSEETITDLQLYDLSGHVVLEWEPKTSITTINLRGLAKGIYMLKVSTEAGSTCQKLVFN